MLDEKTKKILKVAGIVIGVFIIYGFFNLFTGGNQVKQTNLMVGGRETGALSMPMASPEESSFGMNANDAMVKSAPGGNEMMADNSGGLNIDNDTQLTDKKVIKNGELNLRVEKTERASDDIANTAKQFGGEVFSTNFRETVRGQKSGFLIVKVPVAKFEESISAIKKIAVQVISETTTGQDVTEQYSDLQAQLKNKKVEEESFVKILGTAGKMEDVLSATREVNRVRGEVERLEGRIRFMDAQTDMSTITVNLSEDAIVTSVNEGWRPWQVAKQAFRELVSNIQDFADGIIRFIIVGIPSLVPFAILIGLLYWIGKKIFNKINS